MIFVFYAVDPERKKQQYSSQSGKKDRDHLLSEPEQWVDRHGDYLFRIALIRVHDKQLAEDMVQETFFAALKAINSFKGKSSERTWFVSILKRKIIDHFRKSSRIVSLEDESSGESLPDFNAHGKRQGRWKEVYAPMDWGESPLQSLEKNEFQNILQNCIAGLPENMAVVFTMREIDGINTEEICKELNITTSNVWVLLHRARTNLRRCLEIHWFASKKGKG
jgi:RNA polymerase sigma-70 factor (ECF subfamily)